MEQRIDMLERSLKWHRWGIVAAILIALYAAITPSRPRTTTDEIRFGQVGKPGVWIAAGETQAGIMLFSEMPERTNNTEEIAARLDKPYVQIGAQIAANSEGAVEYATVSGASSAAVGIEPDYTAVSFGLSGRMGVLGIDGEYALPGRRS